MSEPYFKKRIFGRFILTFAFLFFVGITIVYAAQWKEPTANPPGDNVETPINISGTGQYKVGRLQIGNSAAEWLNDNLPGFSEPLVSNDAFIFVGGHTSAEDADLRLYIVDNGTDRFSIWGNSCGGGDCGNLRAASLAHYFTGDGTAYHKCIALGTSGTKCSWSDVVSGNLNGWSFGDDYFYDDGEEVIRANDEWLRLNQAGQFTSGVHTPGLFAPGSLNVGGLGGWGNPGAGNVWISGNVGIGTTDPRAKLDVYGDIMSNGSNMWMFHTPDDGRTSLYFGRGSNGTIAEWPIEFRAGGGAYFAGSVSGGGISLYESAGNRYINFNKGGSAIYDAGNMVFQTDDYWYWYSTWHGHNEMKLDYGNGDLSIRGSYYCNQSIDVAEMIYSNNKSGLEAGDVVVVDPDNDETVILSSRPYDPTVAGIISTEPGLVLGSGFEGDTAKGDVELSLVGRVPCKVTTENGSVKRGDLLVTSSKPGFAMKGDPEKIKEMPGVVLGKALEELKEGEGKILVLISLR